MNISITTAIEMVTTTQQQLNQLYQLFANADFDDNTTTQKQELYRQLESLNAYASILQQTKVAKQLRQHSMQARHAEAAIHIVNQTLYDQSPVEASPSLIDTITLHLIGEYTDGDEQAHHLRFKFGTKSQVQWRTHTLVQYLANKGIEYFDSYLTELTYHIAQNIPQYDSPYEWLNMSYLEKQENLQIGDNFITIYLHTP